ncbi:MAG: DNA polymerase [Candidatus Heimdallarchaeota archaeon AB_125]|nr:MAG: DNA polymerase [Candidatus Heimdallarchaeota archaeon AB_125]
MNDAPSPLECVLIDLDFFIREKENDVEEPIIRIRGKTADFQTLIIHVTGFYPYFYIDDLAETTNAIQSLLYTEKEFGDWIKNHYQVTKYRYYQNKPIFLYKILGRNPWRIQKYSNNLREKGIESYENDISYVSRFLIDTNIRCLNWIEITNYEEKESHEFGKVIEVDFHDIKNIDKKDSFQLTILSLNLVINSLTEEGKKIKNFASILEDKKQRIITASLSWSKDGSSIETSSFFLEKEDNDGERKLINDIIDLIHTISPDILVTFNGNLVTLPYLFARMEKLGLDPKRLGPFQDARIKPPIGYLGFRIPGYIAYDLVKSTRWLRTKSGKKNLTEFAKELLSIERKDDYEAINQFWFKTYKQNAKNLKKKLTAACSLDSKIIYDLFFEMGMQEWVEVVKLVGIRPSEGIYSTPRHIGEFQLFRVLKDKGTLVPSEPSREELAYRKSTRSLAIGGFVLVPKGTLHEAVMIADFRSMFPSIMVAFNIGGESYDGSMALPEKKFLNEPDTGIRVMMKNLLDERKEIKKKISDLETYLRTYTDQKKKGQLKKNLHKLKTKSSALKVTANSLYGSHNYVGSRFYNTEISNAITSIAKDYIKKVDKWTQEISDNKCQVIYGDTDSIFVKLADKATVFDLSTRIDEGESFSLSGVPEVQELLEFYESKLPKEMELEFVDLALRIVFAPETKKRYSYISVVTGDLTIVGFEAIRSDTSPFAKEVQTAALQCVLEDGDLEKARKKVIEMCLDFKKISGEELIQKTTILGPVRRNPKDYKSKTPAIGALEDYSMRMDLNLDEIWKEYERFPFIILEGSSSLYKRASHPSIVDVQKIDREHYLEEALRDVKRIGVKVELKDIQTSSQKTLDFSLSLTNNKNSDQK